MWESIASSRTTDMKISSRLCADCLTEACIPCLRYPGQPGRLAQETSRVPPSHPRPGGMFTTTSSTELHAVPSGAVAGHPVAAVAAIVIPSLGHNPTRLAPTRTMSHGASWSLAEVRGGLLHDLYLWRLRTRHDTLRTPLRRGVLQAG